jgi:superoxide reductase
MAKINQYQDISQIDREAKKDYIDRHSPFIHCADKAIKGEKFKVKVQMGNEYPHPDDFDHFIQYIQLWDGETLLGEASFSSGTLGNKPGHAEVDFYIVPVKNNLKLTSIAYCTKHGLWQSDVKEVAAE